MYRTVFVSLLFILLSISYATTSVVSTSYSLVSSAQPFGDKHADFAVWKPEIESSAKFLVEQMNRKEKEVTYKLDRLETEKSAVFDAILYSIDVKLGKMVVPFHFVSLKSPIFSWLSLPSETPELSSLGVLPALSFTGPMEVYFSNNKEVDFRVPHSVDVGPIKQISLVNSDVCIDLTGVKAVELYQPLDVFVSSSDEKELVVNWNKVPKIRLHVDSPHNVRVATNSSNPTRLKVRRKGTYSVELLNSQSSLPSQGHERVTISPTSGVVGHQSLGEELSNAFLRILQANAHVLGSTDDRLNDKMTVLSGKVESVVGFYVSMRLSEERKSLEDGENQAALGSQRWKGLVLGSKKYSNQDLAKTITTSSSLVHAPVSSSSSKFDWQVVASLVKEQPDTRLEVTVDPWVAHNNTVVSRVQQLVDFLGMGFNDLTVRIE